MKSLSESKNTAAIDLVRKKVASALGSGEVPSATTTIAEAVTAKAPSKHQQFMIELSQSGKSLAEVQTEWHRYYTMLSDKDKREVWDEFYAANQGTNYQRLFEKNQTADKVDAYNQNQPQPTSLPSGITVSHQVAAPTQTATPLSQAKTIKRAHHDTPVDEVKKKIIDTVSAGGQLQARHHWQSLFFGLGMGAIVFIVLMFGFFNEMILAPFVTPSRKVSAETPIIASSNVEANASPTVMVPKINIQIPIDFDVPSIDEATMQASLEGGVVHYPSTSLPGQNGNAAYFGHSSQNVFNNGKYKFAFVLLHQVTTGDVFYITYQGKRYVYQVFAKEVVPPTQVSVLSDTKGKQATAVLITCDPPGFSTNRLVVWGEQISPNPVTNTAASPKSTTQPAQLASKGQSAWERFMQALQFWKKDE